MTDEARRLSLLAWRAEHERHTLLGFLAEMTGTDGQHFADLARARFDASSKSAPWWDEYQAMMASFAEPVPFELPVEEVPA